MKVLVLNSGSSSLKFQLLETDAASAAAGTDRALAKGLVDNIGSTAVVRYEPLGKPPVRESSAPTFAAVLFLIVLSWLTVFMS